MQLSVNPRTPEEINFDGSDEKFLNTENRKYMDLSNLSARAGWDTRPVLSEGSNSEFSISKTVGNAKHKEPSVLYNLLRAGGRIVEFMPSPRLLALCEMQTALPRFGLGLSSPFLMMVIITLRVEI